LIAVKSSTPRLLCALLASLFATLAAIDSAQASACGLVYPGALPGPPPEWTFWADGSACYVRWQDSGVSEERLLEKCRQTQGVRFIHFERDRGAGSICIFKILNPLETPGAEPEKTAAANGHRQDPGQGLQSTHYRKTDAEAPVLEDLQSLVTGWTERCLEKEKSEAQNRAASCWKGGAKALADFASSREHVLPAQFSAHVRQLQDAWVKRSTQLEATPVAAVAEPEEKQPPQADEDLSLSAHDGPDPRRLVETAHCSSTRLGDLRRCLRQPRSAGGELYSFGLKSSCSGIIAAIRTYDADGRCIRKVIWIRRGEPASQPIRSYAEPAVLDAISFKSRAVLECYVRRHDEISCDGKRDYDASGMPTAETSRTMAKRQVAKVKRNYKLRYEQAEQPVKYRRQQPGILDAFSTRLKNLVGSD
jgi:hypothetical protein